MNLPELFLDQMKQLLGGEYEDWLESFSNPPAQGLRINTTRLTQSPIPGLVPVPWTSNGYYYPDSLRPARHPYYYAGLYYIQEPSAMAPAQLLPVRPGDRVLDLCAAPGGKSTELGARLQGQGLLVSNDISNSRAKALLKNLELFGISNLCVTSEPPEKLAEVFPGFFDSILVDAPCSGEGMFRKDPDLIRSWLEHGPGDYAPIQREILTQAVSMLRPGGHLLYSTCTFSPVEDEDNLHWLLDAFPDMELCPLAPFPGSSPGIHGEPVLRLFPHKLRGEGHFVALFRKKGADNGIGQEKRKPTTFDNKKELQFLEKHTDFFAFEQQLPAPVDRSRLMVKQDLVYLLPEEFDRSWKLRYLRTGLLLGELKKGRFEPSQALAMAIRPTNSAHVLSFPAEDERVIRYLKGETIHPDEAAAPEKGWCLICVDGFPLGWAKYTGTMLKNKYYPGWRWQ